MLFAFLRLVRLPNLLVVILTQYLLRYLVLLPALRAEGIAPVLTHLEFAVLVFCTVVLTMTGYIINNIMDYGIDLLNKPGRVVVGDVISPRRAYEWYIGLNLVGFGFALWLAFRVEFVGLVLIYPVSMALLWLYSRYFKKWVLVGNILVSLFCAGVAVVILFADRAAFGQLSPDRAGLIWLFFMGYALYAYLSTMYREIVKDMEDVKGDLAYDCRTLPVVAGMQFSKAIAAVFGLTLLAFVFYLWFYLLRHHQMAEMIYVGVALILPILFAIYLLYRAHDTAQFRTLSVVSKFIMLAGILYIPIYYWF